LFCFEVLSCEAWHGSVLVVQHAHVKVQLALLSLLVR
jgi:hypothetical protein